MRRTNLENINFQISPAKHKMYKTIKSLKRFKTARDINFVRRIILRVDDLTRIKFFINIISSMPERN